MALPFDVGDRLWVKEAWRTLQTNDCLSPRHLADDPSKITFEADPEHRTPLWAFGRYRHARFMTRWASRLTLTVTDVRVQRVQDISEADAVAEGIERLKSGRGCYDPRYPHSAVHAGIWHPTARDAYRALWTSLHGPDAWDANPWVAAISFSVARRNIDGGAT